MKTAMQEMMLNIESIESKTTDQEQIYMLTALKIAALVLLAKEKEQIIDFAYGCVQHISREDIEKHYNKTYNNDEINTTIL